MNKSFDSIPNAITARALANNFSQEEKSRRESAIVNKDFFYGDTRKYVSTFNLEVETKTLNLTKPIVTKRTSMLYNRELIRSFEGPQESINFLTSVYEENDIDSFLLSVDLMSELTGSCLVSPVYSEEMDSKIRLQMWDGSEVSVVPEEDNPSKPSAISLVKIVDRLVKGWDRGTPSNERLIKQQIWTNDSIVEYEGSILVGSEENPYGFMPFVNFKGEEVAGQYLGWAPGSLVRKLNSDINQMLTDLVYTIKLQGASPIALSGYQSGEGLVITPGRAISLPAGATASVLSFTPKITEALEVLAYLENKIYETSSVPKISIVGGEGTSGRELMVRWYPVIQVFNEKAIRYQKYEKQLANMILSVAGYQPIDSVHVEFPDKEQLPLSPADETLERDIILGIKTPIDEILRRNPHLTEQDAIDMIVRNNELNIAIGLAAPDGEEETVEEENLDTV